MIPIVRAVVFDYGKVLSLDQDEATFAAMADIIGVPPAELATAFWGHRAPYDRGTVDGQQFWRGIAAALGVDLSQQERALLTCLDGLSWSRINPVMQRWAAELKQHDLMTAICSNMPREPADELLRRRCYLQPFDHVVASCDVGSIKPEPGIFAVLLDTLKVRPEHTLFIDDRADNAEGARAAGMHAIEFKSAAGLAERLQSEVPSLPIAALRAYSSTWAAT